MRRVEQICSSSGDARTLRKRILSELRSWMPFDGYVWILTDPDTAVGSAPYARVPAARELPKLIRLKYGTTVNRWTTLSPDPVASLLDATDGDPARSRLWSEMLRGYGVSDIASMVFEDRFGCWGFLDLWRGAGDVAFSRRELDLLRGIGEIVTDAMRRCQAQLFRPLQVVPLPAGPVVLLLSPELEVRDQTPEAQEYLRILIPPIAEEEPIPAAAYNVAAQLLATEAGVDDHPASARVHLENGVWLTFRASRFRSSGATSQGDIAVTIGEASPTRRTELFSRVFGLSQRESQLLGHLAAGQDTRAVAASMFLTENTVQDHLKSIFAKTGARSRPALLSLARGS
jgi:DNA-binding CsgD family transcriptional regulator